MNKKCTDEKNGYKSKRNERNVPITASRRRREKKQRREKHGKNAK